APTRPRARRARRPAAARAVGPLGRAGAGWSLAAGGGGGARPRRGRPHPRAARRRSRPAAPRGGGRDPPHAHATPAVRGSARGDRVRGGRAMSDDRAPIERWLAEPPPPEVHDALERLSRGADVARVAVMPDVHLSADVCVGVALATHGTLYPAAVGGDIGCGMAALAFETEASRLDDASAAARVLDGLYRAIPVMRHKRS